MNSYFIRSKIDGLLYRILNPYVDYRGKFCELWDATTFQTIDFVEDDISISYKNVLRGFHLDKIATKLITPIYGNIFIVFIDRSFNVQSFYCSDSKRYQFMVWPGIGIAHLVLSDIGMLHYKQDTKYNINNQETIFWNDERVDIHWPVHKDNIILSERDSYHRTI